MWLRLWAKAAPRADGSLRRFARAAAGTISVEFALFSAFVLVPILLVGYDFGSIALEYARTTSAARAGAQYGMRDGEAAVASTLIEQAARIDARDLSLDVTASFMCTCPEDPLVEVDCATFLCVGPVFAPMFIRVFVQSEVNTMMNYPTMDNPYIVRSSMMVRVRP